MALATYLVFFLISHQLLLSLSEEEPNPRCPSFRCGHLGYIGFPFSNRTHPECGLFVVDNCNEQEAPKIQLLKNESFFYVKEISQDNTLMLHYLPFSESFDNYSCIGIGVSSLLIGVLIILALCFKKRLSSDNSTVFWKKKFKDYQNIEAFLRNYGSLAPKRYNYSDIKRMTNSFKHKLGEGGYGGVYKGKLLDGRNVAVKVLSGLKGNGDDFINEVASISRTSHVNIVSLFGYCFESRGRALIYEFMPNGSLEKFIYEKYSPNKQLKWEKLYQIALGIARGLEYLHRGCSTRILHFDIKPHNILIDEDFSPKISDFGLAKICPRKESIVSMTGARGTIGYIAPEVVCRNFGEVSHKSDVYSYGMMVLEMVGGRKNLDVGVDRTSEIYFPHWIYDRLEAAEELGLQGIENDDDNEYARKMLTVSLWCIQTNPSSRPAMSRVVEMLEGSLDSLQFPPKPFLSSSRSEAADSLPSIVC
ncbi:hypothetical protein LWI29_012405 [Acer saccharum]|uniref:Protein kinase domain-containing protein n=1 Tax=Acer saccharum TaxID=4024 RepID=A0AA39T1T3_ACESA|nr:hypothetical protein LWI29_012405 [Acer saccharum]